MPDVATIPQRQAKVSEISRRVLFVDDEPNVLEGIKRLVERKFEVVIAPSGENGLLQIKENGPFAVVVSDMQMPKMNGVEFLNRVRGCAPETVRIMLTGNADQDTAVAAINDVDVDRFLNKPCDRDGLSATLSDAIEIYHQAHIEQDLLERTLQGSVNLLIQLLAVCKPQVFGKGKRLATLAQDIATEMGISADWSLKSSALLSKIGCIDANVEILARLSDGTLLDQGVSDEYYELINNGAELLQAVPRMEAVAEVIRYQYYNQDGSGYPKLMGEHASEVPMASSILRVCNEIESHESAGKSAFEIIASLEENQTRFHADVIRSAITLLNKAGAEEGQLVELTHLTNNMVLMEDVYTKDGVLLVCRGWETNETVRKHLSRAAENGTIGNSVRVVS